MTEEQAKRKLTAILSADVKGYSRLMADDEEATVRTINAYREVMTGLIKDHRGRVVDAKGDNVLAEFSSVVDAVRCAVQVQKELTDRNSELPEHRRMEFRIGINLGDVIEEQGTIYGDGVNVAARLEGLAVGGGICLSGTAFDQVKNRISVGYEYQGKQRVKNISDPVRVYKVLLEPEAAGKVIGEDESRPIKRRWSALAAVVVLAVVAGGLFWNFYVRPDIEPASKDKMAFPLPEKPSIAVLPFDNMSEDPEQEYFSDGITEEIITALSKTPKMFVIARNSTFSYKGKSVKVKQVAEELGVQYVLEGSVRKAGDRVRITAQLIDALTGRHLWAERYDNDLEDIFALQDEITMKIITELRVKLTDGEEARMSAKRTENLQAYLKWLQAMEHFLTMTEEGNAQARPLYEEVIALDPNYAPAYTGLGTTYTMEVILGTSKSPKQSLMKAMELFRKSITLDDSYPTTHTQLGWLYIAMARNYEKAIAECERAVELEPNSAGANMWLSLVLRFAGRHQEAIQVAEKALRLNPLPKGFYLRTLGVAYLFNGRYDDAIATLKRGLNLTPNDFLLLVNLAMAYSKAGQEEEAKDAVAETLRLNPNFSLESAAKRYPYKNKADMEFLLDAGRKAGLPEKPPLPLPDKPSIAVLPFVNMSEDPNQEYFSDGLTEEIISALSKVPNLFVIARNSTFTYKGKPVKVQQVSEELGVRYVLEGSVRKAGDRVRVTAQLIDATTGHHLWSERYDRELKDIFALQDEITMKIATAMQVKLTRGEIARVHAKGTDNLDAYLKFLQGFKHFVRYNPDDYILARRYYKEAIALDPEFAPPYAQMGHIQLAEVRQGRSKSPQKSIGQAFKLAQKVLALDESLHSGHVLLGRIHLIKGQHEKAIAAFERAVALEPSLGGLFNLGEALSFAGRPQEAIPHFKRAIRLNPLDPSLGLLGLGAAYRHMERYEEAITVLKKALYYQPDFFGAHLIIAGCYAALGREEEAHAEAAEALRLNPKFSVKKFAKTLPIRDKAVKELNIDALRKAGLPD